MKVRLGGRFGRWKVISKEVRRNESHVKRVLCKDTITGVKRWVVLSNLYNGSSKGSHLGNLGHSTRFKHKNLPMYVYRFRTETHKDKFRVCIKEKGKVLTLGYFRTLTEARMLTDMMGE